MFRKTLSVIAALFATSAAKATVNSEFEAYLSGEKPMNHEVFMEIWNFFE